MVIADLAMPGLSGDELAARLLTLRPSLPVVLITGFIEPGDQAALLRAGVREVIHKPCTHIELADVVARHLAGSAAARTSAATSMPRVDAL